MKKAFLLVASSALFACAQNSIRPGIRSIASLQDASFAEGIWNVQGSNSARGPYTGELELRRSSDGTYSVVRLVNYISYYYRGLRVQEVWTGKAVPGGDALVISYELKAGDFIVSQGTERRDPEDFKNKIELNEFFKIAPTGSLQAEFTDKYGSQYHEWIRSKRPLQTEPLWSDERTYLDARGEAAVSRGVRAQLTVMKRKIGFDHDPFVQSFRHRKEFREGLPYVVFDPTDYEFYHNNNESLRVVNKPIDSISLTESLLRRNAYALSLAQKLRGYQRDVQNLPAPTSEESLSVGGIYLAAQSIRLMESQDGESLDSWHEALKKIHQGAAPTTSAAIQSELHGLIWAVRALPPTDQKASKILQEIVRSLTAQPAFEKDSLHRAMLSGLNSFLNPQRAGRQEYLNYYSHAVNQPTSKDFYWNGSGDWEDKGLATLDLASELMLAEMLKQESLTQELRNRLARRWLTYAPARRELLTLTAKAFVDRGDKSDLPASARGDFSKSQKMAVWNLREIPYPRPQEALVYDHSQNPEWCLSPFPKDFWKPLAGRKPASPAFYQGLYQYPAFEGSALGDEFSWNEPAFTYQGRAGKSAIPPGVDFIYAYWLARYAGLVNETD